MTYPIRVHQYGNRLLSCVGKVRYGHEETAYDAAVAMQKRYFISLPLLLMPIL